MGTTNPSQFALFAVIMAIAATILIGVTTSPDPLVGNLAFAAFLEAGIFFISLQLVLVFYGRYLQAGTSSDLMITFGFGVLAVRNVAFFALPELVGQGHEGELMIWAPLAIGLIATIVIAPAALATVRLSVLDWTLIVGSAVAALAVGTSGMLSGEPTGSRPLFVGEGVAVAQLLLASAFAALAVAFARSASRTRDRVMVWLGGGFGVLAVATVDYLVFAEETTSISTGDMMRASAYVILAIGASFEVWRYWERLAVAHVREERRRIARDLHDGLAQELAYVVREADALARDHDDSRLNAVARAAIRALGESRRAIHALTTDHADTLEVELAMAIDDVQSRLGGTIRLELDEHIFLDQGARDALVRVASEAVTNALRHSGKPDSVVVRLGAQESSVDLVVTDRGVGIGPGSGEASYHYGLRSMRERCEAVGARLVIEAPVEGGTLVHATFPTASGTGDR